MIIATTETLVGYDIAQSLGMARGSTVRAKHIGSDIVASLRNLVGGEVHEYARLLAGAREQATDRMIEDARQMGADAVVGVRMQTSSISSGNSEILVYGTAVKLK
jgi:uncharacterized protein YbjQ (UPF0145 family)